MVESSTEHAWPSDDVVSVADPIGIGNQSTNADAVAIHDDRVAYGEAFVIEFDTSKEPSRDGKIEAGSVAEKEAEAGLDGEGGDDQMRSPKRQAHEDCIRLDVAGEAARRPVAPTWLGVGKNSRIELQAHLRCGYSDETQLLDVLAQAAISVIAMYAVLCELTTTAAATSCSLTS
ncbi:hypothetical protein HYQ46_010162 [Verticillium longisporum]|nr:hypothetical protein HYQ46_010162 [Verticillium longisporum]